MGESSVKATVAWRRNGASSRERAGNKMRAKEWCVCVCVDEVKAEEGCVPQQQSHALNTKADPVCPLSRWDLSGHQFSWLGSLLVVSGI